MHLLFESKMLKQSIFSFFVSAMLVTSAGAYAHCEDVGSGGGGGAICCTSSGGVLQCEEQLG
jgi:hypothetical protein